MSDRPSLTTESGAPCRRQSDSQTAGPHEPTLLAGQYADSRNWPDSIRERIPHGSCTRGAPARTATFRDDSYMPIGRNASLDSGKRTTCFSAFRPSPPRAAARRRRGPRAVRDDVLPETATDLVRQQYGRSSSPRRHQIPLTSFTRQKPDPVTNWGGRQRQRVGFLLASPEATSFCDAVQRSR